LRWDVTEDKCKPIRRTTAPNHKYQCQMVKENVSMV
jgi:hypothetical protein